MNSHLPSGTVTFLFTDIEGSTRLWQEMPRAMAASHSRHDAIVRAAIEAHSGHIFRVVGDSFSAAFHKAIDGLRAALAAQQGLQAEPWGETGPLRVRMGLHTGAAVPAGDGSKEYDEGYTTLATTQRVMAAAHGGQVLLSQTTADLVESEWPDTVSLRDLGEHQLKDLRAPLRLHQLVADGLPQVFPPIQSPNVIPHNLPARLTSFIGRERELAGIRRLLQSTRLVTLAGAGGTGKTRLSQEAGLRELDSFPHGVWFIELAPLTDPAQIVPAMAQVLGLLDQPFTSLTSLVLDYLREKKALLIFDNCEHLVDGCARLADDLLRQGSSLKIMISSREPLGITGEVIFRVPPMVGQDSIQLFLERARAVSPHFEVTPANEAVIGRISTRLDGIPLAIELAAARVNVLSPEQIAARLDHRFQLLVRGSRTALPHQQTLRALIDWSYDLLTGDERALLRRLSVFVSGWTLEAAEALSPELPVLDLLAQLVNKSLVLAIEDHETTRYQMLETIRQYAQEKLGESGERGRFHGAHAAYFAELAGEIEPKLSTADALSWVKTLELEHDNLRAAFEWLLERNPEEALRIPISISIIWNIRGNQTEGRGWIEAGIAQIEALPTGSGEEQLARKKIIARGLSALLSVVVYQGDNATADRVGEKCIALARELGDQALLARASVFIASGRMVTGDTHGVEEIVAEGLAAARASGDPFTLGLALSVTAELYMFLDRDPETIKAYFEEGIALLKARGNLWNVSNRLLGMSMAARYKGRFDDARAKFATLESILHETGDLYLLNLVHSELAHMDRYEGRLDQAKRIYRETIVEWVRLGHRAAVAHQLESFAFIAAAWEQFERAARLLGAAEALREKIQIEMSPSEKVEYKREVAGLRQAAGAGAVDNWWQQGRKLSTEAAVHLALAEDEEPAA